MEDTLNKSTETPFEVSCPACGVVAKNHSYTTVEIPEGLTVESPRTKKMMPFNDAILDYIHHYFPRLLQTTYRVPAALFYNPKDHYADLKSGTHVTAATEADRTQKDAVEKVVSALYAWGCSKDEVMFILSEYKFSDYFKKIKETKTKHLDGEHDILIFHQKVGIILIEVKSVSVDKSFKSKRRMIKGAMEQLLRNENAFRKINASIDFVEAIQVYRFIAVPNLTMDDLLKMNVCDNHKNITICKNTLQSQKNIQQILSSCFGVALAEGSPRALTDDQYKQLCARYSGFASNVQVRTVGDAVRNVSARMNKFFLTPEQNALLTNHHRKLIIIGEYGTGKSLVIQNLAEQLISSDPSYLVFIVSCTMVSHTGHLQGYRSLLCEQMRHFLTDYDYNDKGPIYVYSVKELVWKSFPGRDPDTQQLSPRFIADAASSLVDLYPESKLALLFDEVPFFPQCDWKPLEDFCQMHPNFYLWMALATGTYAVKDNETPEDMVASKVPSSFFVARLNRSMRLTKNNLRFYKALQIHLGDKGHLFVDDGNAINGPVPRWYELPVCSCGINDPLKCCCIKDRMSRTLHVVWEQLVDAHSSHTAFVFDKIDSFVSSVIVDACKQANIPLNYSKPSSSPTFPDIEVLSENRTCNLLDSISFKGCESPVVIFITTFSWPMVWNDQNGRNGWDNITSQISRALGQIILVTWPPEEMNFFSLKAIEGKSNANKVYVPLTKSQQEQVIKKYHDREQGCYLNALVEKGVLVKYSVPTANE